MLSFFMQLYAFLSEILIVAIFTRKILILADHLKKISY